MTKNIRIQPVIMSGGAGTRLWPLSRSARPKQFLALASERSLFQEAVARVKGAPFLPPAVIASWRHAELAASQSAIIGVEPAAIIAEPCPRNTAAVAAVSALWAEQQNSGALVLLMPADQHMHDAAGFRAAVEGSAAAAAGGRIVTLGVKPTGPHTGFGYIERGEELSPGVFAVKAFREKPDEETAGKYVSGGAHFWNAGVFLFSPDAMLAELERHAPEILERARAAFERGGDEAGVFHLHAEAFAACPSESIDYAVMEKTGRAAVAGPMEVGWSDIGSWSAIGETESPERYCLIDSPGAAVKTDGPFVAIAGVPDIVVVATRDAVLVVPKSRAQDVKKIVEELKQRGRDDLL